MEQSERFGMRVSQDFLDLIDDWRRHQPDIPPRAEAIRRLVQRGFAADESVITNVLAAVSLFAGRVAHPETEEEKLRFYEAVYWLDRALEQAKAAGLCKVEVIEDLKSKLPDLPDDTPKD